MHVDSYPLDDMGKINPRRKWRFDDPGLPIRSSHTNAAYWQDGCYYTAPHEIYQCEKFYPPAQYLPSDVQYAAVEPTYEPVTDGY